MDPVLPIFWNLPAPQVLEQLSSAPQGLSATQAETALARFGPNELRPTGRLRGLRLGGRTGERGRRIWGNPVGAVQGIARHDLAARSDARRMRGDRRGVRGRDARRCVGSVDFAFDYP